MVTAPAQRMPASGGARLDALRLALGAVAAAAPLSLWFARRLPGISLAKDGPPRSWHRPPSPEIAPTA